MLAVLSRPIRLLSKPTKSPSSYNQPLMIQNFRLLRIRLLLEKDVANCRKRLSAKEPRSRKLRSLLRRNKRKILRWLRRSTIKWRLIWISWRKQFDRSSINRIWGELAPSPLTEPRNQIMPESFKKSKIKLMIMLLSWKNWRRTWKIWRRVRRKIRPTVSSISKKLKRRWIVTNQRLQV